MDKEKQLMEIYNKFYKSFFFYFICFYLNYIFVVYYGASLGSLIIVHFQGWFCIRCLGIHITMFVYSKYKLIYINILYIVYNVIYNLYKHLLFKIFTFIRLSIVFLFIMHSFEFIIIKHLIYYDTIIIYLPSLLG